MKHNEKHNVIDEFMKILLSEIQDLYMVSRITNTEAAYILFGMLDQYAEDNDTEKLFEISANNNVTYKMGRYILQKVKDKID